jgi:hypothetical protein
MSSADYAAMYAYRARPKAETECSRRVQLGRTHAHPSLRQPVECNRDFCAQG